jgi:hypothetical protein
MYDECIMYKSCLNLCLPDLTNFGKYEPIKLNTHLTYGPNFRLTPCCNVLVDRIVPPLTIHGKILINLLILNILNYLNVNDFIRK